MHKMHELCDSYTEMECCLMELLKGMKAQGLTTPLVCSNDFQNVTDAIKDLASAKKNNLKACYYKTVIEAMEEYDDDERHYPIVYADEHPYADGRKYYDHYRYSSGRFAPKGRGHYSKSYIPEMDPMMDRIRDDENRIATHLDQYRDARRHYTETHSPEDKAKMTEHGRKHMEETMESVKEIWDTADPVLKRETKEQLLSLVNSMD